MTDVLAIVPPSAAVERRAFLTAALATPLVLGIGGIPLFLPLFAAVLGAPSKLRDREGDAR